MSDSSHDFPNSNDHNQNEVAGPVFFALVCFIILVISIYFLAN
jgi:hypothetical protein